MRWTVLKASTKNDSNKPNLKKFEYIMQKVYISIHIYVQIGVVWKYIFN